jgi:hypothetical protein
MPWNAIARSLKGAAAAMVVKAAQHAAKAAVLAGKKVVTDTLLKKAISELKHNGEGPRE